MIAVSGPTIGRICSIACSVSHSLTHSMTTSATPISARIVGGVHRLDVDRLGAFDAQAVPAHGFEVLAAGDEVNVGGAALDQPRAEIAAEAARSHDCNSHRVSVP